jgi:hypothetical protein
MKHGGDNNSANHRNTQPLRLQQKKLQQFLKQIQIKNDATAFDTYGDTTTPKFVPSILAKALDVTVC